MKVLTVLGARPQFIKASVVSREFVKRGVEELVLHTGQHFDYNMSEVFFNEMEIPRPALNLDIRSGLHGEMTGQMLMGIEKYILQNKPDALLVYGDTNSTLAGALAATKLHITLIHVEAGLRSYNLYMPEEINRILTDRISNLLFCPTEVAKKNLVSEGFDNFKCKYFISGDVMLDAALYYSKKSMERVTVADEKKFDQYILCTIHRAENTNDPVKLKNLIDALNEVNKSIPVILPMHPRTKKIVEALSLKLDFTITEPVGYLDMLKLLQNSTLVMTDSGGLQKEAYFFKKPCICLREETEWSELSEAGYMVLTGSDPDKIISAFKNYKNMASSYKEVFFGNGHASEKIVDEILKY